MPATLAKQILKGGGFPTPAVREGGEALVQLARRYATVSPDAWNAALADADAEEIVYALGGLWSHAPGSPIHEMPALRDAARAMVEQKLTTRMILRMDQLEGTARELTERVVEEMRKLEAVSTRLGWIAIFVGTVGVVATGAALI